ncbi:MAG: acyl--CoA ligase [Roseivirga sp.]|nr:acyl--CoA ligase [Roseivirga sp.]
MNWLLKRFEAYSGKTFICSESDHKTYGDLLKQVQDYKDTLVDHAVQRNSVVAIVGDYCFETIALFFALAEHKCIVVPITSTADNEVKYRLEEGKVDHIITLRPTEVAFAQSSRSNESSNNKYVLKLTQENKSGLILFSSGSSGKPKAMIHDLETLINSFEDRKGKNLNFLVFLMFDHIGGLNTLLNSLAMGVAITIPKERDPEHVCFLIEKYKVNVLPASPTFLNLLLLSQAHTKFDLSSLKLITYGTEPMPETVLLKVKEALPFVKLLQTFGTSETGIAKISSKSSTSNLIRFDDPDYEFKIVNQELWLRSKTQISGYLNASNQNFTEDGWFMTGDIVEEYEDGYLRIIGRNSDLINVGGLKVLPSEVESILIQIPLIADCMVFSESNPITGQIVVAQIVTKSEISSKELKKEIHRFCKNRLDQYKIPAKIKIVDEANYSNRYKKIRRWD